MIMSYEDYLKATGKKDCVYSWQDWKTDVCGMDFDEAKKAYYRTELINK